MDILRGGRADGGTSLELVARMYNINPGAQRGEQRGITLGNQQGIELGEQRGIDIGTLAARTEVARKMKAEGMDAPAHETFSFAVL